MFLTCMARTAIGGGSKFKVGGGGGGGEPLLQERVKTKDIFLYAKH